MKDIREIILSRRSCRAYSSEPLNRERVEALIAEAVWAPSGSNYQPWRFAVIQDRARLAGLSDLAKTNMLQALQDRPELKQYEKYLRDPNSNIFYQASTLVVIYGHNSSRWHTYDCSMVAYNLMLLAEADGLGSCWIGFAHNVLVQEWVKQELGIPAEYSLVAPIILGHRSDNGPRVAIPRKPYEIHFADAEK